MHNRSLRNVMEWFFGVVCALLMVVGVSLGCGSGGDELEDTEFEESSAVSESGPADDLTSDDKLEYEDISIEVIDNDRRGGDDGIEPNYHGNWKGEWIEEKAPPSGRTRYYATGSYKDHKNPDSICGGEWPYDTILQFALDFNQCPDKSRIRIYATNSGTLCAIPGGGSARVYSDGHVDVCIGYWSMVQCFVDANLVKSTAYLWYE